MQHLKETAQGKGWTQAEPRGTDLGVGNPYRYPKETPSQQGGEETSQSRRSPLTNELLDLEEELIRELNYEDVDETDPTPDPEIVEAVAHIPKADARADMEMQDIRPPLGFEPEVAKSGYDVNLVRSYPAEPGSSFPVMAGEDQMLDEGQPKAPRSRRPGQTPYRAADK